MIHPASAVTSLIPALSWRSRRPNAPFAEFVRLSGRLSAKIPDFIGDPGRIRINLFTRIDGAQAISFYGITAVLACPHRFQRQGEADAAAPRRGR